MNLNARIQTPKGKIISKADNNRLQVMIQGQRGIELFEVIVTFNGEIYQIDTYTKVGEPDLLVKHNDIENEKI